MMQSLIVANSFAVMHTGDHHEASLFRKPIVSYIPFKSDFSRDLANDLDIKTSNKNKLADISNVLYNNSKFKNQKNSKPISKILSKNLC